MSLSNSLAGFRSQVFISQTSGGTFNLIAKLREVTLTVERDTIDVSSHSSAGWKDNILGLAQWSGSAEHLYIENEATQDELYDALVDREVLFFRFVPKGTDAVAGDRRYTSQGIITSWEWSGPNDDAQATSVEILGCAPLVKEVIV